MRYLTAGESHGPALVGILEGCPAGVAVKGSAIDCDLARRQGGYGRGGRMAIERDRAEILSGVRRGVTLGSPIALLVRNRDHANWKSAMGAAARGPEPAPVVLPRPGHADLPGLLKYGFADVRNVIERASARETAVRVALGSLAKQFLANFQIEIASRVVRIGSVATRSPFAAEYAEALLRYEACPVRCADKVAAKRMMKLIDRAKREGDSLGGIVEACAFGVPPGLGSYAHWDQRLDGRLAGAVMAIPAIKGVEIGLGFAAASRPGSRVHDPIVRRGAGLGYRGNHAGGLLGGISSGEPLLIRAAMKPIPTLTRPLPTINLATGEVADAAKERSDTCAVPAAAVVVEAVVALELMRAFLDKFGADTLTEARRNFDGYLNNL